MTARVDEGSVHRVCAFTVMLNTALCKIKKKEEKIYEITDVHFALWIVSFVTYIQMYTKG